MAGMRIVDENGNEIANPDLSAGTLSPTIVVKKGAVPPDDVEKFAWADDDYEEAMLYAVPTPEEAAMAVERGRAAEEAAARELIRAAVLDEEATGAVRNER